MNAGIVDEAAERAVQDLDSAMVGPILQFDGLRQLLQRTSVPHLELLTPTRSVTWTRPSGL